MVSYLKMALIGALFLCISGCAGFISGDLKDFSTKGPGPGRFCENKLNSNSVYKIEIHSDAKNDYGNSNISGWVSSLSLGLVPTYWTSSIHVKVKVLKDGKEYYSDETVSRVHKFYGILWLFILPTTGSNYVPADEGAGMRVEETILSLSVAKLIGEVPDLTRQNMCIVDIYPRKLPLDYK